MKKFKFILLALSLLTLTSVAAFAQDDMIIPEEDESTFVPPPVSSDSNNPPVILDESDSADVSDVEEYDG